MDQQPISHKGLRLDLNRILTQEDFALPDFPDGTAPPDIGTPLFVFPLEENAPEKNKSNWLLVVGLKPDDTFGFFIFGYGVRQEIGGYDPTRHGKPFSISMLFDHFPETAQNYDQPMLIENAVVDKETGKLKVGEVFPHIWCVTNDAGEVKGKKVAVKWQVRPDGKYLELPRAAVIHPNPPTPNTSVFQAVDLEALEIERFVPSNAPRIMGTKPEAHIKIAPQLVFAKVGEEPALQEGWFWMWLGNYEDGCNDGVSRAGLNVVNRMFEKAKTPQDIPLMKPKTSA